MENNNQNKKDETSTEIASRSAQVPQRSEVSSCSGAEAITIYKPTLVREDPLQLDSSALSYASKLLQASNNGLIPVRLEEDVIIQRISHDLYSDPKSGFRELYNNEARACRIARKNYPGTNPRIVVTVKPSERKLVIHGIDSMGMSQQKFLTVYTVLGRSDNFDSTEVGQFGMGRAAYTCLSDIMVLETYSRETGEKYAVMGKNGVGYNVLPKPTDLDSYGTRITITLRDGISIPDLVEYIFDVCRFSGIRTTIELEEEVDDFNDSFHAGHYELGLESMKEYVVSLREKNEDEEKLLLSVEIADDPDLYLYGEIIARKSSWEEDYSRILDSKSSAGTYLVNVPIEGDLGELPLSRWILNIKDERKYPPTADRERLTDAATSTIREKLMAALKEKLQPALKLDSLSDYVRSPYRILYRTHNTYYYGFAEHLLLMLDDRTREIVEFVNTKVKVLRRKRNGMMCRTETKIADLIDRCYNGMQLFCVRNIRSAAADALREKTAGEVFESDSGLTDLMARFGVMDGDLYVKENDLKRTTYNRPDTITAYYKSGYTTYSEKIHVDSMVTAAEEEQQEESGTAACPKQHRLLPLIAMTSEQKDEYVQLMDHDTNYRIVVCGRNDARKKRLLQGRCTFLDDFVSVVAKKDVVTSMGRMSAEETLNCIMERDMDVALLVYDDPQALAASTGKLLHGYDGDNSSDDYNRKSILSVVVPDEDSRYELKVFYRYHGVATTLGWHDVFRDAEHGLSDVDRLDEQKANVIVHAMAAFGERYPELFELLAHAMGDTEYCNAEKLREYAFSLATMLDEKRADDSVCTARANAAAKAECLAKITEWV
jgi:hypothetical protein